MKASCDSILLVSRCAMPAVAKPRSRKPEPKPYHHGDLRASLLAAAARWLDEQGAETLTLRELARAAGVSPPAPSHHSANRDELMAGVAELAFDRLGDALAAAAGGPDAA